MERNGPKIGLNASPLLGMVLAQKPQDGSKRLGASFFMQNQSVSIIVSPFSRNAKAPFEALYFLLPIICAYQDLLNRDLLQVLAENGPTRFGAREGWALDTRNRGARDTKHLSNLLLSHTRFT